jgi:hypothetical protein
LVAADHKASLKEFLRSGTLGAIKPGVPMRFVGERLGPPKYWSFPTGDVPCFWGYDRFEIHFSPRAPHNVIAVQLCNVASIRGARVSLHRRMPMMLDGFDGSSRPSLLMDLDYWQERSLDISILRLPGELQLYVERYPISMLYCHVHSDHDPDSDCEKVFDDGDWPGLVRHLDQRVKLHSVSSFSRRKWEDRRWSAPTLAIPKNVYRRAVSGETAPEA